MATIETFDDIILGGGKGGKSLAMALGPAGHKVALIERGQIGGSCINVACIPTKTLVASAKIFEQAKRAQEFGLNLEQPAPGLAGIIERKRRVVKGMVDKHHTLFSTTKNMEFLLGSGKFTDKKVIEVKLADGTQRLLTATRIYINTGSKTSIPEIEGLSEIPYLTSTSIMELDKLPAHLAIVGGGYIALEFAQIFARLGSRVTVLLRGKRFLPNEDLDVAEMVKELLSQDGITFRSGVVIDSVSKSGERVMLKLKTGANQESFECSHLMVAIGRTPNTADLNLAACGVETDSRGNIKVNDQLETNVPGIWALGDCNGGPLFTHVSWDDYRIVRDNVLKNANRSTKDRLVPYTLFIDPELGRVGLTEEQAKQKGYDVLVAKMAAQNIPRANTSGESKGMLKAIVDKRNGQILGCSLLCHSAGEVMSVVQTAMLGKLTYTTVRDTIYTHPTMAESLNLLFAGID